VRDRPRLGVVETGITVERLGICVRKGNTALRKAISKARSELTADGTPAVLIQQSLGSEATLPASTSSRSD
jgi:ABC-type amino acid transport substrate-binding protein